MLHAHIRGENAHFGKLLPTYLRKTVVCRSTFNENDVALISQFRYRTQRERPLVYVFGRSVLLVWLRRCYSPGQLIGPLKKRQAIAAAWLPPS